MPGHVLVPFWPHSPPVVISVRGTGIPTRKYTSCFQIQQHGRCLCNTIAEAFYLFIFLQSEQYSVGAQRDPEEKPTEVVVIQLARIQGKIKLVGWV